jgi:cob(I)alamin adenosyltransferase
MKPKQGLVIVNTGTGKGKTTASMGMMLRAWGHDQRVVVLQFIKHASVGEHRAAQRMDIEMVAGGAGFTFRGQSEEKNELMTKELWKVAAEKIGSGSYDTVILDELTYALNYGWVALDEVLDTIRQRPGHVHIIITGRGAPQALIDLADTASEINEIKHAHRKGIKAQAGIEF